eukprot:GFUD01087993.1.p1 GENE.GFUD01087993.1~~GFUD01087993.1.p1  ORF type:complete len:111 (+),score=43.93 GFUD01087993.1:1-333(+)
MTSEAWDKFKHRDKRKKTWAREKIYLTLVTSVIILCALGTISSFTKSKIIEETSENSDGTAEEKGGSEDLNDDYEDEDKDAESSEDTEDYDYDEYDDWTDTYFGEEIWVG